MEGINVVIFLVHCATNLLLCDTVPTEHLRFGDMETCRSEALELVAEKQNLPGAQVWMAKCRYQLAAPDSSNIRQAQTAQSSYPNMTTGASR